MRAVLLAGGAGRRLRPLTNYRPKPLLPIANRPLLARLLEHLAACGVDEATLAIGVAQQEIAAALGDGGGLGLSLRYSIEKSPLGSGGAIAAALRDWPGAAAGEPLLVCNADIVSDFDPRDLLRAHRARRAQASLALARVDDAAGFGVVALQPDGRISRFVEKPPPAQADSCWVNAGFWLLQPALLSGLAPDRFSRLEEELFPALAAAGGPIFGLPLRQGAAAPLWIDVGTPAAYLDANRALLRRQGARIDAAARVDPGATIEGPVQLAAGVVVGRGARLSGPLALGPDCRVGAGAELRDSVAWARVRLGAGARVCGSVLTDDVRVAPGERLRGALRTREPAEAAALG